MLQLISVCSSERIIKSNSLCQSYTPMIKGPFLAHSVYLTNNMVYIGDSVFMNAETFARQS